MNKNIVRFTMSVVTAAAMMAGMAAPAFAAPKYYNTPAYEAAKETGTAAAAPAVVFADTTASGVSCTNTGGIEVVPVNDVEVVPISDMEVIQIRDVEVVPISEVEIVPIRDIEVIPIK